mmetsp:Transcript_74501/g.192222  ORF Transcript_74501/g.192222 Transcript_74501/m.192222 type:complete len:286 (-) Transcript_74501:737-1594(-)
MPRPAAARPCWCSAALPWSSTSSSERPRVLAGSRCPRRRQNPAPRPARSRCLPGCRSPTRQAAWCRAPATRGSCCSGCSATCWRPPPSCERQPRPRLWPHPLQPPAACSSRGQAQQRCSWRASALQPCSTWPGPRPSSWRRPHPGRQGRPHASWHPGPPPHPPHGQACCQRQASPPYSLPPAPLRRPPPRPPPSPPSPTCPPSRRLPQPRRHPFPSHVPPYRPPPSWSSRHSPPHLDLSPSPLLRSSRPDHVSRPSPAHLPSRPYPPSHAPLPSCPSRPSSPPPP